MIIVDDCSTDETPAICTALSRENSCIQVVRHEHNWGHIATYNHGLELVNADYVHLISADDELTPFALDRSVAIMRRHHDVGMVYGRVSFLTLHPSLHISKRPTYSIIKGADWIEARCRDGRNPIYSPEVTLRRIISHEVGLYDPRLPLTADLEMWLRVAARSNVAIIENTDQALYRVHHQNMHLTHAKEGLIRCLQERADAYKIFFDRYGHLLAEPQRLHSLARSKVARDILRRAGLAFSGGYINKADLIKALDYAQSVIPDAHQLPEWRFIQRRLDKDSWSLCRWQMLDKLTTRLRIWWEWRVKNSDLGHRGLQVIYSGWLP